MVIRHLGARRFPWEPALQGIVDVGARPCGTATNLLRLVDACDIGPPLRPARRPACSLAPARPIVRMAQFADGAKRMTGRCFAAVRTEPDLASYGAYHATTGAQATSRRAFV